MRHDRKEVNCMAFVSELVAVARERLVIVKDIR